MLALLAALACSLAGGCASGPALPKRATLETAGTPESRIDYAATVAEADIIYFPAERAVSGARSEPAALLLEALQASSVPFAIGWDIIAAEQQPLLDQISSAKGAERDDVIGRLDLAGTGRAREHCRAVLREGAGIQYLALKLPERSGPATAESADAPQLSMRFKLPPGGIETFAERMTAAESLSGRDVASAYRAQVIMEQFAAEQIVRFFQTRGIPKLLVFMRAADLESGVGVPSYVSQKLQLRQLVLGPNATHSSASRLLTAARDGSVRRSLEIVDGAPASARH